VHICSVMYVSRRGGLVLFPLSLFLFFADHILLTNIHLFFSFFLPINCPKSDGFCPFDEKKYGRSSVTEICSFFFSDTTISSLMIL